MQEENHNPLLLCLDLEAGSDELAHYVAAHARRCRQPVEVLYVSHTLLDSDNRNELEGRIQQLIERFLADAGVCVVHLEVGVPEVVIPDIAAARHADTIIMGRRHRTTVDRIYVGSTTSAVISLARRPVLVVPVGNFEDAVE